MLKKKSVSIGFVLLTTLGLIVLWAQPWFNFDVALPSTSEPIIAIDGSVAATSLSGLCLAMLALTAVLSLSRGLMAILLALLGLALSTVGIIATISAVSNPLSASISVFSKFTGLTSAAQIQAYVTSVSLTPAAFLVVLVAFLNVAAWVLVSVTARSWRTGRTRKYVATMTSIDTPRSSQNQTDAIADWDDLSTGVDPTSR